MLLICSDIMIKTFTKSSIRVCYSIPRPPTNCYISNQPLTFRILSFIKLIKFCNKTIMRSTLFIAVCEMMGSGVAGIFGPYSDATSDHVQSICDAMEIPHIEMRWDSRQRRGSCLVNLYPHPSTMTKVQ